MPRELGESATPHKRRESVKVSKVSASNPGRGKRPQLSEEVVVSSESDSTSVEHSSGSQSIASGREKNKKPDLRATRRSEPPGSPVPAESSSESSSGNESDSSSSSAASSSEGSDGRQNKSRQGERRTRQDRPGAIAPVQTTESRPRRPHAPPNGFKLATIRANPSPKLLKSTNLVGKQIWQIVAPSTVPLASIEEVAQDCVQRGKSVLSHDGADYVFVSAVGESNHAGVLVPSEENNTYSLIPQEVSQTLQLQQRVRLPQLQKPSHPTNTNPMSANAARMSDEHPRRKQPSRLRMRFLPAGVGDAKLRDTGSGSSESDNEIMTAVGEERSPHKVSNGVGKEGPATKRENRNVEDRANDDAEGMLQSPRKRKREGKHKKDRISGHRDVMEIDGIDSHPTHEERQPDGQSRAFQTESKKKHRRPMIGDGHTEDLRAGRRTGSTDTYEAEGRKKHKTAKSHRDKRTEGSSSSTQLPMAKPPSSTDEHKQKTPQSGNKHREMRETDRGSENHRRLNGHTI